MPTFIPPKFPTLDGAQMAQKFNKLSQILKEHSVDGQLQLKQLQSLAATSNDPFIQDALNDLVQKNSTTKTVNKQVAVEEYHYEKPYPESLSATRVSDGWHYETRATNVQEVPDALKPEATQGVFSAVKTAQQAVLKMLGSEVGGSQAELVRFAAAGNNDLWSGRIAEKAVALELQPYQAQQVDFQLTIQRLRTVEQSARELAGQHGADPISQEALGWYLRAEALKQGLKLDAGAADRVLNGAEQQKHGFIFKKPNLGKGHLSAEEVGKLIGSSDLKAYSVQMRAQIEGQIGGRYEAVLASNA